MNSQQQRNDNQVELILQKMTKVYGHVPKLYKRMAMETPHLLIAYNNLEEKLNDSSFSSEEKQLIMLSYSVINDSKACGLFHAEVLEMYRSDLSEDLLAIMKGEKARDKKVFALTNMVRKLHDKHGRLNPKDYLEFESAGYSREQIFDIVHIMAVKTVTNLCVNLCEEF